MFSPASNWFRRSLLGATPSRKSCLALVAALIGAIILTSGCATRTKQYVSRDRMRNGLIIVLPGIEGRGLLSEAIVAGLADANIDQAIRYYDWGWPVPVAGLVVNQVDTVRAEKRRPGWPK